MSCWDADAEGFISFLENVNFVFNGQNDSRAFLREFKWIDRGTDGFVQVKGRGIRLEEILIGNGYRETPAKVAEVLNSHNEGVKTTNLLTDI